MNTNYIRSETTRSNFLYVTSSSYSGSTLLAFLLNTHPEIFTVSEMIGWNFAEDEDFRCSCGEPLDRCIFFAKIAKDLSTGNLPFKPNQFGTTFRIVASERLNRYLTQNFPRYRNSFLERMRDAIIWHLPVLGHRCKRIALANLTFVKTSLRYSGSKIFVDVSKEPHRMRHLSRIPEFDMSILYLVRDIRGVVVSNMRERANDIRTAARIWLYDQHDIMRISQEFAQTHTLHYEDLCMNVDHELAAIHSFLGISHVAYPGHFKGGEHHILGNSMRTKEISKIVVDQKWMSALTSKQLDIIRGEVLDFLAANPATPARTVIEHYLNSDGWNI